MEDMRKERRYFDVWGRGGFIRYMRAISRQ
jgi:hypothetical protein